MRAAATVSFFSDVERECRVATRTDVADGVVMLDIVATNGRDLPPWTPGSHIDLLVADAGGERIERQYSLCGDVADRSRYRVAVLREDIGRGGSALVHDTVRAGEPLRIRGPRNHFGYEADPAVPVVFIAGGIGITPFLSMAAAARDAGVDFRLLYAGRSRSSMAFAETLLAEYGDSVQLFPAEEGRRLDTASVIRTLPEEGEVYCCGPVRLVEAVEAEWGERPSARLHVEHFEAKEFGPPVWQAPFEIELALTGVTAEVPLDRSVLDVVEEQGVLVVSSCRKGTCGTCETPVLDGDIEHRDSVLTPDEQAAGDTMMICVSRAAGPLLVLDL